MPDKQWNLCIICTAIVMVIFIEIKCVLYIGKYGMSMCEVLESSLAIRLLLNYFIFYARTKWYDEEVIFPFILRSSELHVTLN